MSGFEIGVIVSLGAIAGGLLSIASSLERANRHLSNIADRLLDILLNKSGPR